MKTILPGICHIYTLPCDDLPADLGERHLVGLPISIEEEITEIPFAGEPTCSSLKEPKNNGHVCKTELKFVSTELIEENKHIAFIVTAPSGNSYLIGTYEKPYPQVRRTIVFGQPQDYSGFSYEVTLNSIVGVMPCNI